MRVPFLSATLFLVTAAGGCNAISGVNKFSVAGSGDGNDADISNPDAEDAAPDANPGASDDGGAEAGDPSADASDELDHECETNAQCTQRATNGLGARDGDVVPAICLKSTHRCAPLLTEDCTLVTGDYQNDDAIVIGSLLSTTGSLAATNIQRRQSATLAVEEINAAGGIVAPPSGGSARPLVMVSCDAAANLLRAGNHLIADLQVPAIMGPNISQDTLDLSTQLSIPSGTLIISPAAVASSIADLLDNDLTWLMVPTDVQRAPLMIQQINDLETQIKSSRSPANVNLGIIYRNDALGVGTRVALDTLILNGKPLSDPLNAGTDSGHVKIDPYDPTMTSQDALVAKYKAFAPDIIAIAGTAEAVTTVIHPLEQQWTGPNRPYYVAIDSTKVPELIAEVTGNDDLRHRIRGTGVKPSALSAPINNTFTLDYLARYGSTPTASATGTSYDATYALAYALVAERDLPVTGANIAKGLRKLAGGPTAVETGTQKLLAAFQHLAVGEMISARGTFGLLSWDPNGAVLGGVIEMWCIGAPSGTPAYQSSGLTYDLETQLFGGTYTQCAP